ncbi:MAG TPA: hypothetical protein VKJ45_07025, partial [Blastocatellia bacterium]|nr:hypothetical protein [Blastocatellia bacterium]
MSTRSLGDIKGSVPSSESGIDETISPVLPNVDIRSGKEASQSNELSELGQKIFLDRYALKDMRKRTLSVGDLVIVCVDVKTGQREIGEVRTIEAGSGRVIVDLRNGSSVECLNEPVSKPIETEPEQMMERVARGIAAVESEYASEWYA